MTRTYEPTTRFTNVNNLLTNHFRFEIAGLPDLTFFAVTCSLPDIQSPAPVRPTPFTDIVEVGDKLSFGALTIGYLIDNAFKTYYSLYYWMKGYAFPTSYEDITVFDAFRKQQLANPKPQRREIQKTHATLYLLQPDTDGPVAEVNFFDMFPTGIGPLRFSAAPNEPDNLTTAVSFAYTNFEITLV